MGQGVYYDLSVEEKRRDDALLIVVKCLLQPPMFLKTHVELLIIDIIDALNERDKKLPAKIVLQFLDLTSIMSSAADILKELQDFIKERSVNSEFRVTSTGLTGTAVATINRALGEVYFDLLKSALEEPVSKK